MDFRRPKPGRAGGIRFLFDCGPLAENVLAGIVLQPEEISAYRLAALPDALGLLRGPIRRRVRAAAGRTRLVYLEDGRPVPGVGEAGLRRGRVPPRSPARSAGAHAPGAVG